MRGHSQRVKILVVDDDPHLLRVLERNLQLEGYEVITACDGEQALGQLAANMPDLILLDAISPRLDGFQICQRVRESSFMPIICMTAPGCAREKCRLFELGVSEYVTSSFDMSDLLAYIDAVLHTRFRSYIPEEALLSTAIGDLTVNYEGSQVMMAGREVPLTQVEYRLVACLAQHAGRIVPQDCLIEQVWGKAQRSHYHVLRVNINRLRCKLESDPARPRYLITKHGVGYLLTHPG
jgi:DNA-binding response OmpR family regulator